MIPVPKEIVEIMQTDEVIDFFLLGISIYINIIETNSLFIARANKTIQSSSGIQVKTTSIWCTFCIS